MKRLLRRRAPNTPRRSIFKLLAFTACLVPSLAHASLEVDRLYALETIGALKSWDNVDGLFADYVQNAYKDYFSHQSRFVFQDLSKADAVLKHSKLPYGKLIEDAQVLGQIARSTRAQSLLRTRVSKQGPEYKFTIDWLHSPRMDVLATESWVLEPAKEATGLGNVQGSIQTGLDRLFAKLPFVAMVTGRDERSVTVNVGASSGIKRGDTLVIGTLDEVKKHPLLKQIVDWRFSPTGKAEVETVDEGLAFARITEETEGRQVGRYQKILQIQGKPFKKDEPVIINESEEKKDEEPPRLGWASAALWLGGFSREYNSAAGGKSGSGLLLGMRTEAQLWWNRELFTELGFGFGLWGYSQSDIGAATTPGPGSIGQSSAASNLVQIKVAAGYNYLGRPDLFDPKGWVKIGYRSNNYSLPATSTASGDLLNPITFNSAFLGMGADLPIRSGWSVLANLDFGIFNSASERGAIPQSADSATDVTFFVGVQYRYRNRISLRGGIEVISNGADLAGGATLSHRIVSFSPTIVYFF
ncbi:MAG TPA: hypothetical protein VM598_00510 [Bdellovibrionota bacterium]|nr:hypothetical protein [Bdellovibrionota bacterium]